MHRATADQPPINTAFVLSCAIAVVLTFMAHESAHWLAGTLLGNRMFLHGNGAGPISRAYLQQWHSTVVDIAGPLFTLAQALAVGLWMRHRYGPDSGARTVLWWFPLLLSALMLRLIAGGLNLMQPQDELRVATDLGWPSYTVVLLICAALAAVTWLTARRYQLSARFTLIGACLVSALLTLWVLGDNWIRQL